MSLKSELLTYQAALEAYDSRQYSLALDHFGKIAETSKVQWNMGMILASMGRHNEAIATFSESVVMDQYLVVGWYQRGVSYFMVGLYDKAVKDFDMASTYMRGNNTINYTQLGLAHTLHSAEILYNLGLTKLYLRQTSAGIQDLRRAQTEKTLPEHGVIDDCIRDQGRGYSVFSVAEGLLFRPSESKLKNLKARDYMGKAVLVAASDPNDAYTTFTGITRLQRGQTPTGAPLDSSHPLSRSATISTSTTTKARSDGDVDLPIANLMAKRSQTVRNGPKTLPALPSPGLTRSLTVSNPDPPSPARHARSRTADSTSIYTTSSVIPAPAPLMRPTRPRIVIPGETIAPNLAASLQSDRYPSFPTPLERNRLYPPTSYSSSTTTQGMEVLQTPQDRHSPLDEIYDEYRSPTPELEADAPEMPYTAIGRSFASPSPISAGKVHSPSLPPSSYRAPTMGSLSRAESTRSNPALSRSASTATRGQGLMLTVEDADGLSPLSSPQDLIKIRVKVHHGDHTRGMSIYPSDTYANFVRALRAKFPNLGQQVAVRFRDEDGDMLSMQDDGDFEAAVDVARVLSKGRAEGKLEIWID